MLLGKIVGKDMTPYKLVNEWQLNDVRICIRPGNLLPGRNKFIADKDIHPLISNRFTFGTVTLQYSLHL